MDKVAPFSEDFLGGLCVGPGRVLVCPVKTCEGRSSGGIILVESEEAKYVKAHVGRVVNCGILYDARSGAAECELFPIPKDWLVGYHPHEEIVAGHFGGKPVLAIKAIDVIWASPPEETAGARAPDREPSPARPGSAASHLPGAPARFTTCI